MRNIFLLNQTVILVTFFTTMLVAQNPVPNPGFENWNDGNPNGWITSNVPDAYTTISQSASSHTGNYALKGEVVNFAEVNITPTMLPEDGLITISQNYTRLTGYYQMTNLGEDALFAEVLLYDSETSPVAAGLAELGPTIGGYQMFTVDLEYVFGNQQPAVSAYVLFAISLSSTATVEDITAGSNFLLDDLAFDMVSSVNNEETVPAPLVFTLGQNYPNPFNPVTNISFVLPSAEQVVLTVYNNLGQNIKTLLDESMAAGIHQVTFDAAKIPSGVYYYKLEAGTYSSIKRMMLVK